MSTVRGLPPTQPSPSRGEGPTVGSIILPPPPLRGRVGVGGCLTALLLIACLSLAGCGKKGPPSPPAGVPNTYPQNYPAQ
jgi:hypothetical protein